MKCQSAPSSRAGLPRRCQRTGTHGSCARAPTPPQDDQSGVGSGPLPRPGLARGGVTQGLLSPSSWEMRGHQPPGPGISHRHGELPVEPSRSPRSRKEGTEPSSIGTRKHRRCGPQPVTRGPPRHPHLEAEGGRGAQLTQRLRRQSAHTRPVTPVPGAPQTRESVSGQRRGSSPEQRAEPPPTARGHGRLPESSIKDGSTLGDRNAMKRFRW